MKIGSKYGQILAKSVRRFEHNTIDVLDFGQGVNDVPEVEQETIDDLDLNQGAIDGFGG